jgi:heat shock protein HtpX
MRLLLFFATNVAVLIVLWLVTSLLGIDQYLTQQGLNYGALLAFCAVFGFGGSFFSLMISRWIAKRSTGAVVIGPPRSDTESWLLQTVAHHAQAAGIGMPEVAIFPSDTPNAFATGASRNKALVAVSTGLLQRMNRQEVEAVLGHEVGHVANGDMVTMTLLQGVLNTFVMFLARVVAFVLDQFLRGNNERGGGLGYIGYMMVVIVAQMALTPLAWIIISWFSRRREFRADGEGARLAGRAGMISALERLKSLSEAEAQPLPDQLKAFGIFGRAGRARLFASHPPLDERIEALRRAA